ncbi:MAG: hypothetical protein FWC66_09490, partial [Oscillospiraceae bacterium]|nr:hypothetical protein [Oscillospiraceae bacterium]
NILADFLQEHFEEVANMLAREYSFEEELEARLEEGMEKGMEQGVVESAIKLLKKGMSLSEVTETLELSDDLVRRLEDILA